MAERSPYRLCGQHSNRYGSVIDIVGYPWNKEISTSRQLIFHLVRGKKDGLMLGINAGTHGDEATSIMLAYQVFLLAAENLKAGTLLALPQANPEAVEMKKRGAPYMDPSDETDLNRAFNFDEVTTPLTRIQRHAQTIAGRFCSAFMATDPDIGLRQLKHPNPFPGLVVDFHTEDLNTAGDVVPYVRIDPTLDDEVLGFMIYCSEILGIPWAMESEHYFSDGLDKSLTGYLVKQSIPSLTIELGPGGSIDNKYVIAARVMMEKLMAHFGMIELSDNQSGKDVPSQFPGEIASVIRSIKQNGPLQLVDGYCKDINGQDSMARGSLRLEIKPGQLVNKGDVVGHIVNYAKWPTVETPIYAEHDRCYILSVPGSEVLEYKPGDLAYQAAVPLTDERIKRIHKQQKNIVKLNTL